MGSRVYVKFYYIFQNDSHDAYSVFMSDYRTMQQGLKVFFIFIIMIIIYRCWIVHTYAFCIFILPFKN